VASVERSISEYLGISGTKAALTKSGTARIPISEETKAAESKAWSFAERRGNLQREEFR
jgi:hypothetical protein